jgi:hypothetical protein
MNYRFTDSDFPGGKGKPAWFHKKMTPPQKRRAWFDEYNRRASNGEDDLAESQEHSIQLDITPDISTLAGEIEAARQQHRQRTGKAPRIAKIPPAVRRRRSRTGPSQCQAR